MPEDTSMSKSDNYDPEFLKENMMGPNAVRILEELTTRLPIRSDMRILDLGCGRGLTSIFLAKEYGATVYASDLWIPATENYARFKALGFEDKIIPIHAEAHNLPYANEYFDLAISVDAYHYFGFEDDYLTKHLAPLVKRGGNIAVAVPGLKKEFGSDIPVPMQPFWNDDMHSIHSRDWWIENFNKCQSIEITHCWEMDCMQQAWQDWLECDNEYARHDIEMMEAEGGNYFNFVALVANVV